MVLTRAEQERTVESCASQEAIEKDNEDRKIGRRKKPRREAFLAYTRQPLPSPQPFSFEGTKLCCFFYSSLIQEGEF
jgi:hypothetical protein